MDAWIEGVIGVTIGVLLGGVIGYVARTYEFRRDHRVSVYNEFAATFLTSARRGATLASYDLQVGPLQEFRQAVDRARYLREHPDKVRPGEKVPPAEQVRLDEEFAAAYAREYAAHDEARTAFDVASVRCRLFGSPEVLTAAAEVEAWLVKNVDLALPFRRNFKEAGEEAKLGPSRVAVKSVEVARAFAEVARRDLSGRKHK